MTDSCVYDPEVDNYPSYETFAALFEDITEHPADLKHLEPVSFFPTPDLVPPIPPLIEQYSPIEYQEEGEYDVDLDPILSPLMFLDSAEYEQKIDEFGILIHWNKIT